MVTLAVAPRLPNHVYLACPQEPDVFGVRWEAANGKPGYADLCIKLMDAAYPIVPNALFFVEGTAQYASGYDGLSFNWGTPLPLCVQHHHLAALPLLQVACRSR